MDLPLAVSTLESIFGDPSCGLSEEISFFVSRATPIVNVDLLIQDERGRTPLTWRDDEFFGAGWHAGGIIRYKEMVAGRIRANPPTPGQWHECCPSDLLSMQSHDARFFSGVR